MYKSFEKQPTSMWEVTGVRQYTIDVKCKKVFTSYRKLSQGFTIVTSTGFRKERGVQVLWCKINPFLYAGNVVKYILFERSQLTT